MSATKKGDTVRVHFTGYLKDGTVAESTDGKQPVEFTIGQGLVIAGIEKAVTGMVAGGTRSVTIAPEYAYGPRKKELVSRVNRSRVRGNIDLRPGMKLRARTSTGIIKDVIVRDISDDMVIVDANHPLAGEELVFEIKLVEIL